jgi:hypothetical protein
LETNTDFPKNVRILSWNYDHQFDMAYCSYIGDKRISNGRRLLNTITKFDHRKKNDDRFSIYKLNGICGTHKVRELFPHFPVEIMESPFSLDHLDACVFHFALIKYYGTELHPAVSFAWEKQDEDNDIVKVAIAGCSDAEILICIGYSFPFFNRTVDREIIGSMKSLRKVYFQDPYPQNIMQRFKSIRPDIYRSIVDENLIPISDYSEQFFLPPEL